MYKRNIIITGGAGFIGSHVVRLFVNKYPEYRIINVDKLTYAGNLENLIDVEKKQNYVFIKADICEFEKIDTIFKEYNVDSIIHLAAESHVDRSIMNPMDFVMTNVVGTVTLLNVALNNWKNNFENKIFYHVSTDEVYGSLEMEGYFYETTPYNPRSPYSASKASSDHFVRAYFHTYNLPIKISNCSNNYGPFQFPEKLIPLMIINIMNNKPLPVYGKGENVRDWLYVEDHAEAIDIIFHYGTIGETYNIGGDNEWKNIDLVKFICRLMDEKLNYPPGSSEKLITFVKDRPGHDLRYAINCSKLKNTLGWKPKTNFKDGLIKTINWYLENAKWVNNVITGEYEKYYQKQYLER
ncbi:MAG: dTDP-glucose 4,6-dehydratase [Bacteroidales bacterium]|nr:dTDP-glucose 4,6-dehydratase [Bacteroidales bacterium]